MNDIGFLNTKTRPETSHPDDTDQISSDQVMPGSAGHTRPCTQETVTKKMRQSANANEGCGYSHATLTRCVLVIQQNLASSSASVN